MELNEMTKPQARKYLAELAEPKNLSISSIAYSQEAFKKIASVASGFAKNYFSMRGGFIKACKEGKFLTDGYLIILDGQIAKEFIDDNPKYDKCDYDYANEKIPDVSIIIPNQIATEKVVFTKLFYSQGQFCAEVNGKEDKVVDIDKVAFMMRYLPNCEFRIDYNDLKLQVIKDDKIVGLIMMIIKVVEH
jgi:hypothetical protein